MQEQISPAEATFARQLVERLSSRLENEKRELVLFLIELAEFDGKKLALELAYPSTLSCLVTELGLSESSACRRIAAARLLARFPQIASYLLASRLTLMALMALKDVLDDSNVDELLERASGLSEPNVRQLVLNIRLGDAPATPPAASVAADAVATSVETHEEVQALTLWVGRDFREELDAVRALLGHAVPNGKKEDVLLHVLRAQRKVLERRRYGGPKRASESTPPPASSANRRSIPAAVRREVYDRESGSCAYVGEGGRRCGSTLRLEYQHIIPFACGGTSTPANVTLYCRAHNLLQAKKDFGEEHIRRKQLERRAASALGALGYKRKEAEQVVGVALQELQQESGLEASCGRACGSFRASSRKGAGVRPLPGAESEGKLGWELKLKIVWAILRGRMKRKSMIHGATICRICNEPELELEPEPFHPRPLPSGGFRPAQANR